MHETTPYNKLTLPLFLQLIRLPVKLASVMPFALGTLYAWYDQRGFNWVNTLIYFVGQMSIACFVTGFNNVQDFHKSHDEDYRQNGNILGTAHLNPQRIMALMLTLLGVAVCAGLVLVVRTDLVLLFIGATAIAIAIFYTFGPMPISRLPIGELVSSMTEGFGTFFIAYFVNVPHRPLGLDLSWQAFVLHGDVATIAKLLLVAAPIIVLEANIMFANNIGDIQEDITNHRATLAVYLGHDRSLAIYRWVPVAADVAIVAAVALGVMPWPTLLVLGLWPVIHKNIRRFLAVQVRRLTFKTAVNNLLLTAGAEVLVLAGWTIWKLF
ncbi:UbiA family prenyltransferase [Lacticaseibacillus parakribbianus]|uniref:UbiA family prenyltransferase n=1 Tax=Lacticaseibacillus parakribbianus TaxID=2970927 RepID=UPI0021CB12F2|nr:UbiA family prenyltransferase [Lacticaseibacillus parakribbianus]